MNIKNIIQEEVEGLLLKETPASEIHDVYYDKISKETFYDLIGADPTSKPEKDKMGKYSKWILRQYQKDNLKTEDLYKVNDYLDTFIKYASRIEEKDINKYKSLSDLYATIKQFKEDDDPTNIFTKEDNLKTGKKLIKQGSAEIFHTNKNWVVIIPKTEEAACFFGSNTEWCTATTPTERNAFDDYKKRGNLYIFIDRNNPKNKYQLHVQDGQFMDVDDNEYPVDNIIGWKLFKTILENEGLKYITLDDKTLNNHEFMIEIVENFYCDDRGGYSYRDIISKKTIIEVLEGDFYADFYGDYNDLDELIFQDEIKSKIYKTLEQRENSIGMNEIYELDSGDLLDFIEEEHDDIFDNLQMIYRSASEGKYMDEFYGAIKKQINNVDEYVYNLLKYELPNEVVENEKCIAVYEPRYGFNSYVTEESYLEYFKEYYEF